MISGCKFVTYRGGKWASVAGSGIYESMFVMGQKQLVSWWETLFLTKFLYTQLACQYDHKI